MDKKAVAQSMVDLQESLENNDLSNMFQHLDELERLAGEEYMMKVLSTFSRQLSDSMLVKEYIQQVLEDHPELYNNFFGIEEKEGNE